MNENEARNAEAMSFDDVRESVLERYTGGESAAEESTPISESVPAESEATSEASEVIGIPVHQSIVGYDETMEFAKARDRASELERENESLRRELEESRQARTQEALSKNEGIGDIPELDLDGMLYASDEERGRMLAEYNRKLIELAAKQATADMLGRVQPLIRQYDEATVENEMNSALEELSTLEGWGDVRERKGEIRRLSERDEFSAMNPTQRMAVAALIDRGLRAGASRDVNAMADEVMANAELMKVITARNAREVRDKNVNIPAHSAGGGFGSAAYSVPARPSSFDEVREKYGLI